MQAITWCFPVEYIAGADFTIDKPADYETWKSLVPNLDPPWSGPLFDWTASHPRTLEKRRLVFDPANESPGWWLYRRIANRASFAPGSHAGSITLVNWPQNDYFLGNIIEVAEVERDRHLAAARALSRSLLYWMQTDAPRPDGGTGWPGLRLRPELVDSADGLAKSPYIRESRRIEAEFTVREEHVGTDARSARTGKSGAELTAAPFDDSVGVGSYRIDLHPTTGGDNYIDIGSLPFQIPFGSLLPVRVENLLAGAKNIGTTHITNGCYRLHPVEWNIGESAGLACAYCLSRGLSPRQLRAAKPRLADFQRVLAGSGVELAWPRVTPR